jgi:outer membrane protein assembly factor BamB
LLCIGERLSHCHLFLSAAVIFVPLSQAFSAVDPATDWPAWRGPTRDGIAAPGQNPPLHWSETEGVLWKAPVPGRGHGSPTVVGDRVYLATADVENQFVLCLNRKTGQAVWETKVHGGQPDPGHHSNSSAASSTVACDGSRLYSNFLNDGAVYTSALDLDGKLIWQHKVCDFVTHQGFGSSPVLYGSLVIVSADNRGGGLIAALNRQTGDLVYPKNHTVAVFADGSSRVAWQNTARVYVPSMIQKEGHLYAVMDAGLAVCWAADTGTEMWKERLGGDFFASPVMVGSRIYATNLRAKTFVFEATPKHFELLAQNQLGDEAYASPVICGNRIYLRVGAHADKREEYLYCIGNASVDKRYLP